jgi:hypothetical protein
MRLSTKANGGLPPTFCNTSLIRPLVTARSGAADVGAPAADVEDMGDGCMPDAGTSAGETGAVDADAIGTAMKRSAADSTTR